MTFLSAYREMPVKHMAFMSAGAAAISLICGVGTPHIFAVALSSPPRPPVTLRTIELAFGESPHCRNVRPAALADYFILFPAQMRKGESRQLVLSVRPSIYLRHVCAELARTGFQAEAVAASPGMDIVTTEPSLKAVRAATDWHWIARPKEAGDFIVMVSLSSPDGGEFDSERLLRNEHLVDATDGGLAIRVSVLTELGLSLRTERILQVVGALLGLLGTILAYPFLKRWMVKGA